MQVTAFLFGVLVYIVYRVFIRAFYTVKPDERAIITSFGRAQRLGRLMVEDDSLEEEEKERYRVPRLRTISPGGPYFKWPWQEVHKVRVVTQAIDLTWDPTKAQSTVEAVTKDNLTTGVGGQIRFRVSENNLYAYFFGVESPLEHVMGYFISVLRERIANFVDPKGQSLVGDTETLRERRPVRALGGGLDQRSAQKPAAAQRLHGAAVPLHRRALWHRAGCRAHHPDRSAARGGPRALGHQHHAQPGGRRHQHRPRRCRTADHHEQAGGGHRPQQRPGRGRAARRNWPIRWRRSRRWAARTR